MRRHDHCRPRFCDTAQQGDNLAGGLDVEVTRRLIGNNHFRIVQYAAGNGYTLLFTTRQFVGETVGTVQHIYILQYVVDAFVNLRLVLPSCSFQHETQVLANRAVCQQLEVLEDDTHLSAQGGNVLTLHLGQFVIQHDGLFGLVNIQLKIERLQQGALAGSHASNDINELALVDVEIYFLQHEDTILLVDIRFLIVYEHISYILLLIFTSFSLRPWPHDADGPIRGRGACAVLRQHPRCADLYRPTKR